MEIQFKINEPLKLDDIIAVYRNSGIRRPFDDPPRMARMFDNSNLVISAWDGSRLVGISRCLVDYGWVCYLSDLLVDREYQHSGIGRELIQRTRQKIGPACQLLLLSAPGAMEYYPKVGFVEVANAFKIDRDL